jgi:TRAP transporter TAXI family solute receptor
MRLLSLLLLVASACRQGPNSAAVEQDLQAGLDQHFGDGFFRVADFTRRGHYPFENTDDPTEHILIYYDAELELLQDRKLSDWDQLNVGSLISIIGATPRGVVGVKPEGNVASDRLEVRGAMAYVEADDEWQRTSFRQLDSDSNGRAPSDKLQLPYHAQLERLDALGAKLRSREARTELDRIQRELKEVVAHTERRLARRAGAITVATAKADGDYYLLGQRIAEVLRDSGTEAQAFETSGSRENCALLEAGEVAFALVQNDVAHMAWKGSDLFANEYPHRGLRAVCSLYPEAVHVLVLESSPIRNIADLRGRRINLGPEGSGSRLNGLGVLAAAGVVLGELAAVTAEPLEQALARLRAGELDAVIATRALPTPTINDFATDTPVRLLAISSEVRAALRQGQPFYVDMTVPPRTYPGLTAPVITVGVTATLATHERTADDQVHTLLTELFANLPRVSRDSQQAYLISRSSALSGLSTPLHPAAAKFFEQSKP